MPKSPMTYVLFIRLALVLAISHCGKASSEESTPQMCLGDNKVFVNDVTTSNNGVLSQSTRIGTCDKGDPINIQVIEKPTVVKVYVRPTPRKLKPRTGGEYEYTASLPLSP